MHRRMKLTTVLGLGLVGAALAVSACASQEGTTSPPDVAATHFFLTKNDARSSRRGKRELGHVRDR